MKKKLETWLKFRETPEYCAPVVVVVVLGGGGGGGGGGSGGGDCGGDSGGFRVGPRQRLQL